MLALTRDTNDEVSSKKETIYINEDHIVLVQPYYRSGSVHGSIVTLTADVCVYVDEDPEFIERKATSAFKRKTSHLEPERPM